MTGTNLSLPVSERKAIIALVIMLFGSGMISGYLGGELFGLIGVFVVFFGGFYLWRDYQMQKKAQKKSIIKEGAKW
jgi:hypothetical protein